MPDDRLEAALRDTLRAEVGSAGLSISRAELHRRAERAGTGSLAMPRLLAPLLAVFVVAVGLVVVLGTRPGGFIAGPGGTASISPSPSPSPTDPPSPIPTQEEPVGPLFDPLRPTLSGEFGQEVEGWVGCYDHGTNSQGTEFFEDCGPSYEEPERMGVTIGETVTLRVNPPWGMTSWRIDLLPVESVDPVGLLPFEGRELVTAGTSEKPIEQLTFVLPEAQGSYVLIATVSLDGADPQLLETVLAFRIDMSDSGR
jgi:hypothetical protein